MATELELLRSLTLQEEEAEENTDDDGIDEGSDDDDDEEDDEEETLEEGMHYENQYGEAENPEESYE
jgi:hypothetical protein